ncbi:MAG: sugar phosphate isomerase/epimerase [Pseudomonadota bacterium]
MTDYGYQLYSSRNFPPLHDTLGMLADLGYTHVEGYGALYLDADAVKSLSSGLSQSGLTMPTGHFGLEQVETSPADVVRIAEALGIEAVIFPFLQPDARPTDAAGWAALGTRVARAAEPIWAAGLSVGWHNHDFEMRPCADGSFPLDHILAADPRLKLELDVAWVQMADQDPLPWINAYADRLISAHVKDIAAAGTAEDEDGWADVGYGVMDWPTLMAALRAGATRYFIMEHDNPSDHRRFAGRSLEAAQSF